MSWGGGRLEVEEEEELKKKKNKNKKNVLSYTLATGDKNKNNSPLLT